MTIYTIADSGGGRRGRPPPFWNSKEGLQTGPSKNIRACGTRDSRCAPPPFPQILDPPLIYNISGVLNPTTSLLSWEDTNLTLPTDWVVSARYDINRNNDINRDNNPELNGPPRTAYGFFPPIRDLGFFLNQEHQGPDCVEMILIYH